MKDKFDSVIRSHQPPTAEQSEGGDVHSRQDFEEDDVSIDEDDTVSNDNNNSSGGGGALDESEIMN